METKDFFQPFRNELNKSVLKYAAGLHIQCPNCKTILDWKTVVLIDVFDGDHSHKGQIVSCTNCFRPEGIKKMEGKGLQFEITQYVI